MDGLFTHMVTYECDLCERMVSSGWKFLWTTKTGQPKDATLCEQCYDHTDPDPPEYIGHNSRTGHARRMPFGR